ncbi:MAG: c-type cytochrome biogenesis protein CcmI [Rhizobiales bacterium]|nr:c-type cytochrome biogenesis protein CcmI [Hyphomicrobiales bacterium]
MIFWLAMAGLTAAVMAALVWPLSRRAPEAASRAQYDAAIYRDQLAELERDAARGIIGPAEAEAARNEVSRRILGTLGGEASADAGAPRTVRPALWAALLVPFVAVPIYLWAGSPRLPDLPLQARLDNAVEANDLDALVARVEAHLAKNPGDVAGWQVLAPVYRRMERFGDAANAYARILSLGSPTAELFADFAEMRVYANQGLVTADAIIPLREALRLDSKNPKARFFIALADKQEGKTAEALAGWKALLADSPPDASWRALVENEIAAIEKPTPGPTQEQVVAAEKMSAADRDTMIRGMVDGLEARLKADGKDLDGWRRLINARIVLGERDKAKASLDEARIAMKQAPDALTQLDALARQLGME